MKFREIHELTAWGSEPNVHEIYAVHERPETRAAL